MKPALVRATGLLLAASLLLAGCGGLSDVGDQKDDSPPTAAVVVLNQPFTKDASGKVTTRVRAGTEVFLSGKDSDGLVAPVLKYQWSMLTQSPLASQISLVTRNTTTISFAAPAIAQDTTLQLRLKVTDANGKTDQKDVDVLVLGIPDANHFLAYNLDDTRKVKIVPIASRDVAAAELQGGGDVGFEVTVKRLVDYTTPGVDGPYLEVDSEVLTGKWSANFGAGGTCNDVRNPALQTDIPAVNVDDILAKVDAANPALEPDPAQVDTYKVKLQIAIRVTSGTLPAGVSPLVCADRVAAPPVEAATAQGNSAKQVMTTQKSHDGRMFAQTDPASGLLEVDMESLLGPPGSTADTPQSARAYYAAIDPQDQRTTFLKWLQVNGFVAASKTSIAWADVAAGSSAHAVYTNNYDLGFGRDMYARIVRCDGAVPALGQPIADASIGSCDIAAVVVNYSSLESASKKLNPVLAVAMEYSKPAGVDRRIVQFFTFAPDSVTSEFKRVLSANLDGRGEKYVPQTCTVCHGGTPGGLTAQGAYQHGGDVNTTFLPWDLDSFLFSDAQGNNADGSYTDQTQRSLYTRAAQADELRKLNQIAYLTYQDSSRPNRFTLPKQLVAGWYGSQAGSAFTSTTFNGQFTPAGWTPNGVDGLPNTADDNPADSQTLYHDVFARNCRACHVAQAPSLAASGSALETLTDNGTAFNECDNAKVAGEPAWTGAQSQLPLACYRQFLNARNLAKRLSTGQMPFARLTMDRFWVAPGTPTSSPGDEVFDHLTREFAALPVADRPTLSVPGTPSACFSGLTADVEPGTDYPLDASCSLFPQRFKWTLQAPAGSTASIAFADSGSAVLHGVDRKGIYTVTLETADNVTQSVSKPRVDRPVVIATVAQQQISPQAGQNTRDIAINATGGEGGLTLGSVASADASVAQAQLVDNQTIRITGVNVSSDTVPVTFTVTDGDGDAAAGQFVVAVKAGLAAASFQSAPATVRRTGTAGSSIDINLLPQVTRVAGQELEFFVSNDNGVVGRDGTRGTVSVGLNSGVVTYTPPQGRMSQFRSSPTTVVGLTSAGNALHDTFSYTVRYRDDTTTVANGTVTVPIEGNTTSNVSFASMYSGAPDDLDSKCSACHISAVSAPAWFNNDQKTTYCNLRSGSDSNQAPDSGVAYVAVATPSSSALYRKPNGELNHQNAAVVIAGAADLRTKILNWISEGAYYTNSANQDCP